jgi:anti-anti-sigma factor
VHHELLTVDVLPDRERIILAPHGELDQFSASLLRETISETIASGWDDVVLDLRKLTFMDSGGVHLLQDLRDGVFGDARFTMIDGTGPAALPLHMLGGPRFLPLAEVGSEHALV